MTAFSPRPRPGRPRPAPAAACLPTVCLVLVFALAACVPTGGVGGGTPRGGRAPDQLAEADGAFDSGDYRTAAALYRRALDSASGPRRETLLGLYGLSSERAGDYSSAVSAYLSLDEQFPDSAYGRAQRPRLPDLLLLAGRAADAKNLAGSLAGTTTDPAARAALNLSAGRADYSLGNYRDALVAYILAMTGATTQTREQAARGLEASLLNMRPDQLAEVVRQYGQNYPGPEACWYLAWLAASSGDQENYARWSRYFKSYFSSHPWAVKLAALEVGPDSPEAAPPGRDYDPRPVMAPPAPPGREGAPALGSMSGARGTVVVGALLPLTSAENTQLAQNNVRLARMALAGLRLALGTDPRVVVEEMDTGGDPGQVVRLVHEAAARPEVMVLVGPVSSREALAAAQTAQTVAMPIIVVSQRLGLTVGREWVLRLFLTPKHQAEAAARYAVKNMGLERLGALYPDDQYGRGMLGYFSAEAARLGASMGATSAYAPGQGGYSEAVNRLTGGGSVRRASISYQAPVDFQALYLPDSASAVAQILPLLAFNDVTRMTYLGSPLWLVPELAQNYGRYMQGAVIPAAISTLSERPQTVRFQEEFARATGQPAEQFAAYGHDSGLAVATALGRGAGTRAELVRALLALGPFEGATGPFSFGPDGDYQVDPMMVTVEGNSFKLLAEPAEYR